MPPLDNVALERSSVVANSRMNRQRQAEGVNSYERELGFSPIAFLSARIANGDAATWLDLCCGEGRALVEAANFFGPSVTMPKVNLRGVDLVDQFDDVPPHADYLRLEAASIHDWQAAERFDLITCVHGLHYIGDKLGLIERAATWLADDGTFAANLDVANVRNANGRSLARQFAKRLRSCGFEYNTRRHLLLRNGRAEPEFGYHYLGADDAAGPNYSGQEAVNSLYEGRR